MNPEDVGQILDQITDRLAPASQAAWDIMVTQVVISSGFALAGGIFLLIGAIASYIWLWRASREWRGDDKPMSRTFGGVGAATVVFAAACFIYNGVIGLVIPEYHLLNQFLNILTGT